MENIKKILVPTDFSPNATKALDYAVQVARQTQSSILLLHIAESDEMLETTEANSDKMELIKKSIHETSSVVINTKLIRGLVIDSILDSIPTDEIDLVIMGTVGNSRLSEKVFGSKTAKLIGGSPIPVLAIPLLSEWGTHPDILLAINDFKVEDKKINPVIELARLLHSRLQVAIFTDTDDDYVEDYDVHEKKIAIFRDALKIKYPGLEINAVHLASRHFMDSLTHWIDKNDIGMLVMLTHKRNIFEKIFNHSLTRKMSYHTNIPLLAIPV
jgi:nucleotide-binding universal stress UspA family protein